MNYLSQFFFRATDSLVILLCVWGEKVVAGQQDQGHGQGKDLHHLQYSLVQMQGRV